MTRRVVHLAGSFALRLGGTLPAVDIACETWGELSPERDNVVLVATGLSPGAHVCSSPQDPSPGWWEAMVGPGRPIDTERFFVVCCNSLGSCHGSTGPASIDPATGAPYRLRFPLLCIEDVASAARRALEQLGISKLRCVVGPSLGGMTALAYAILFPHEVENLVSISSCARALPFAIALRSLQREIVRSDPEWCGGDYPDSAGPRMGLSLARKLGMISYRSEREWRDRFGRERVDVSQEVTDPFGHYFEVEDYLEAHAQKFVGTFDANSFLYLSRAMDMFDAAEHGGSLEDAFARIQARRSLIIGVETDILFPIDQQEELAATLTQVGRDAQLVRLPAIHGHDSFLVDTDLFGPAVAKFLSEI